ncbi:MAG: ABC transporter permease [Candidatus Rokubacteria bacterium]|nr:ABC transporter permease [Candidatus Rokubacteria bacterium]
MRDGVLTGPQGHTASLRPTPTMVPSSLGRTARAARASLRQPVGLLSAVVVFVLATLGILSAHIAPYSPNETIFSPYLPPGAGVLLGTDKLGRDVLSRLIWGARLTFYVGLVSVGVSITLGTFWGIVTSYFGGPVDTLTQRCVDMLMALPPIVLALSVMAAVGQSVNNVILALGILLTPTAIRTVRPIVLSIRETAYIEAARAIGCSRARIVLRHIVPNCVAIYIVLFSINIGYAVVVEASLSFLGVGIPPDEPSWGAMLAASMVDAARAPWLMIFPALAIFLAVLSLNLLGDTIRDIFDPRLRRELR